ncbi:uncharacterized protein LOC111105418 [Crassostrea virginica]
MDLSISMFLVLMRFIFITKATGTQYFTINKTETWRNAHDMCLENGFNLSPLSHVDVGSVLQNCSLVGVSDVWTSTSIYKTPYLSLVGCFTREATQPTILLKEASVLECQISCDDYPCFAITKNECACLRTDQDLDRALNNKQCNYTCDGVRCGGNEAFSVYRRVEEGSLVRGDPTRLQMISSICVVYQCVNNRVVYQERNCKDNNTVYEAEYFSCTFEPGDECFLVHSTHDHLDWFIKNSVLNQYSVYNPSYYAYVDVPGANSGQTALLISSTGFKASNWCLRFRYFASSVTSVDVMILDIIQNQTKTIVKLRNATKTLTTDPDWYNFQQNINNGHDFKLLFRFQDFNQASIIAIEDITLMLGNCNETLTTLIHQRGEIQCTFGGGVDWCFTQYTKYDKADWNLSDNQASLGKNEAGRSAILMSIFELQDMSVNICVGYSMANATLVFRTIYGNTEVNDTANSMLILCIRMNFYAKSKIYINGTTTSSTPSSEIRVYFMNITILSRFKRTQLNRTLLGSVPDPFALSISDEGKVSCVSDGPQRFTNTIRLQGEHLSANVNPSAVLIYRTNDSTRYWEKFTPATKRHFVCENDTGALSSCRVYMEIKPLQGKTTGRQ